MNAIVAADFFINCTLCIPFFSFSVKLNLLLGRTKRAQKTRRHPEGLAANLIFLFHLGQEMLELVYRRNETLVFR